VPPLSDPDRLSAFVDALGNWNFSGYIQFALTDQAFRWLRREFGNITLKEIGRLMHEHVEGGGIIDEVPEIRAEWSDQQ
jgi:hypothetical protein